MPTISVIIPVYNVRDFIVRCATSLMNQTYKDAEYIFVDDKSTDGSIQMLEEILAANPHIQARIVHHEKNQGLPAARRTGMMYASGEFVLNCDSDDFVENNMLELLYQAVSDNNADYAYCDFYLTYHNTERYFRCPYFSTPLDALRDGYLSGSAKYNVWNKLIRRSLYEGVEFPVDHRKGGEDMIMFDVLSKAKSVAYVPKALYHYVKYNDKAISEQFSQQRLIDIKYNADSAIAAVLRNCEADLTSEIEYFKLNVKLQFLISDDDAKHAVWREWYPESNGYAFKNKHVSFRTRIIQWMAAHSQWWFIKMYYKIVYKFLYTTVFR